MFYPRVFPRSTDQLPAAKVLQIEASAMAALVQADRAYVASLADEPLILLLVDELRCLGKVGDAEVEGTFDLLANNEQALHDFVRTALQEPPAASDWEWIVPDYESIRAALGTAAEAEWRDRVADVQARGRGKQVGAAG